MMGTMPVASALLESLDDEQREAVLAPRGPLCVLAGAGTGKTRTITCRIAHLVAAGHIAPGQVLAVTFTQRAAGVGWRRPRARGRRRRRGPGWGAGGAVPRPPPPSASVLLAACRRRDLLGTAR